MPAKVTMNIKNIQEELLRRAEELEPEVRSLAEEVLELDKKELEQTFLNHPVSKEIKEGDGKIDHNITGTLGGKGNLFSFIGFYAGSDPVGDLISIIKEYIFLLSSKPKVRKNKSKYTATFSYTYNYPTLRDIQNDTPMPWESGRSWVAGIERGISGLGNYLRGRFEQSRSGGAIQAKNKVRAATYTRTPYFTAIMKEFIKNKKITV